MSELRLETLHPGILQEYLQLSVAPGQETFIETPQVSLRHMETRAWDIPWTIECIFDGSIMIGYAMHGENREGCVWLDRFMIDGRFQGRGYGREALRMLLERLKDLYPVRREILLSAEPENTRAIALYERYGFQMTGDMDGGEAVMILRDSTVSEKKG